MKTLKLFSLTTLLACFGAAGVFAQTAVQKTSKPVVKKAQVKPAVKKPQAAAAAKKPSAPVAKKAVRPASLVEISTRPAANRPAVPAPTPFDEAVARISSADPVLRRQGADTLARSRDQRASPYLLKALSDAVPGVRAAAVDGLCQLNNREATAKISELLVKDPDATVRQQAAGSLGYMMDPASGPALVKALKDKEIAVRYAAANTLGAMKYVQAEDPLIDSLSDAEMRRIAISALGQVKSVKAAKTIAVSLADPDKFTRIEAIKALGSIGDASAAGEMKKLLGKAEDPSIRVEAALALAKLGMDDGLLAAYDYGRVSDISLKTKALEIFSLVGDARTSQYIDEAYATETDPVSKSMYDFARQRLAARLKALKPAN